jgi:hypothetical protein
MRQAKWLLIAAVAIFLILPGCQSTTPTGNTDPGVKIAAMTEEIAGPIPIMTGGKQPQTQLGDVYIYWQYDHYDPEADPGEDGNGRFIDLSLVVKYVTYEPMTDAQLNIDQNEPVGKGAPGRYNFNDYLVTELPATTVYFVIPVADFERISGWDCGEWVWMLCHVTVGGETGMAGQFHHPKGGAWWNDIHLECKNPTEGGNDYDNETAWGYDIYNPDIWFWAVMEEHAPNKWGGVIPYTLGGTNPTTVDLWAGAGRNDPAKGALVGTVTVWDGYEGTDPTRYVYVKYDITLSPWVILGVHFGADPTLQDMYDRTNFAPGQLGNAYDGLAELTSFTEKMEYDPAWGTSFVVAAHAEVATTSSMTQIQIGAPQE